MNFRKIIIRSLINLFRGKVHKGLKPLKKKKVIQGYNESKLDIFTVPDPYKKPKRNKKNKYGIKSHEMSLKVKKKKPKPRRYIREEGSKVSPNNSKLTLAKF